MRPLLALLFVSLLAGLVALAAWVLLAPAPPPATPGVSLEGPDAPDGPPREGTPARAPLEGAGLRASTEAGGPREGPTWPVVPSDRIPRGTLEVVPHGPDLEPLDPDAVTVRLLERPGAPLWSEPLGMRDKETRAWTFRNVPHGRIFVDAWGDHVAHQKKEVEVVAGTTTRVDLFLDRAGAVAYRATLPEGGAPESVTVRLRSARTNQPVAVHFQTRKADLLTTDVRGTEATLGDTGLLFAVPAGSYVLEAESAGGQALSRDVEVRLGETTEVELPFGY